MDLDLKRFIVFNTSDGQGEGCENDKLLFHWTKDVPDNKVELTEQIDDVCMCDASINASSRLSMGVSFCPEQVSNEYASLGSKSHSKLDPLYRDDNNQSIVITFDPTIVVMVEVEPRQSIWMAAHIGPKQVTEKDQTFSNQSQDNTPVDAVKQVIQNIYKRFCLLNGTFAMIADRVLQSGSCINESVDVSEDTVRREFRTICESYFTLAVAEIHLASLILNIASLHNYVVYLELKPVTMMKVISFVNLMVSIDCSQIIHTITIFNDQLIWSSLNASDSRLLYNYLVAVHIKDALQEELARETDKVRLIAEDLPVYLEDDMNRKSDSSEDGLSSVELYDKLKLTKYYLTVFRSRNNLTLGIIMKEAHQTELKQRCEQLLVTDSKPGVMPLTSLGKLVGQNFIKTSTGTFSNGANNSMISVSSKRRTSSSASNSAKSFPLVDHRYLSLDRTSFSVSSFFNADAQSKDGLHLGPLDGINLTSCNRKQRFIKHILDLEQDMRRISLKTGSQVEEYLVKTNNETWLTALNSKYRCTYSMCRMKSGSLSEIHENTVNLKSNLLINRL